MTCRVDISKVKWRRASKLGAGTFTFPVKAGLSNQTLRRFCSPPSCNNNASPITPCRRSVLDVSLASRLVRHRYGSN
ncbi:hypothetical protein NQ318_002480 [Aromia moschata]|uniref:DUF4236 domain-containing protein n=1 Tax=Aromia moschata TaxID=1265417 RepID=A0AAV8Y844_9CUCU|nr:hypothetical protein NQ318_002480 [Aromia moschata]